MVATGDGDPVEDDVAEDITDGVDVGDVVHSWDGDGDGDEDGDGDGV